MKGFLKENEVEKKPPTSNRLGKLSLARFVLPAAMAMCLSVPVIAAETEALSEEMHIMPYISSDEPSPAVDTPQITLFDQEVSAILTPMRMYGYIVNETESTIEVREVSLNQPEANPEDGSLEDSHFENGNTIILHISESTCIIDAVTGQAASINERETDRVVVFYGPAATLSLPPQSNALAIAVNQPEDKVSPHYAVVESVDRYEDSVRVLTDGGSMYVTIGQDAPIMPYLTRNIVTIDMIREGTELMLWYEAVNTSYPGQALAEKAVIIRNPLSEDIAPMPEINESSPEAGLPETGLPEAGSPEIGFEEDIQEEVELLPETNAADTIIFYASESAASVNGMDVNLVGLRYADDGVMMLPLRQLCEALNYTVRWIPETESAEISRGATVVTLAFGEAVCQLNGLTFTLSQAPLTENGVTFVTADFFEKVLNIMLTEQ